MSEEYQTEEEQIEALKRWWKENGKSIIAGLVLGIGSIGGYRYWQARLQSLSLSICTAVLATTPLILQWPVMQYY